MYGDAVQLPDGKIMIINGYNNNLTEPGNSNDIPGPSGLTTRPVLIDPYASPATAVPQTAWPEPTHRGYHAIALLLKDGRILVGGGKDASHETGCEKAEMRIYVPPYLQGNPTRPAITNATRGSTSRWAAGPSPSTTPARAERPRRGPAGARAPSPTASTPASATSR